MSRAFSKMFLLLAINCPGSAVIAAAGFAALVLSAAGMSL
jgi:hypothetical protein